MESERESDMADCKRCLEADKGLLKLRASEDELEKKERNNNNDNDNKEKERKREKERKKGNVEE